MKSKKLQQEQMRVEMLQTELSKYISGRISGAQFITIREREHFNTACNLLSLLGRFRYNENEIKIIRKNFDRSESWSKEVEL